jgi:prevent-host-death family protein
MKNTKLLTTTTFRNHLADVIDEVNEKEDYVLVTQRGEPRAALVNIDFFEDLLAANSPAFIKSIEEAREDFKAGRVYTHEQVFGDL